MSSPLIRQGDSPAKVQQKLGLNNIQFDDFKHFARRAHGEYCSTHPSSKWADINADWRAVPEGEKLAVFELMLNMCTNSNLFPNEIGQGVIRSGIWQRLHQVRRLWRQYLRATSPKIPARGADGGDNGGMGSAAWG